MANPGPVDQMAELMARAQKDDGFRQRLLAEPEEALREEGVSLPPGVKVKVLENTAELIHIVLPAKLEALADEVLDKVTAGMVIERPDPSAEPKPPEYKSCGNYTCPLSHGSLDCLLMTAATVFLCKQWDFKNDRFF